MNQAPETMTLRAVVDEAEAIVRRLFPQEGSAPPGLKLELVRSIRKAEWRGYQECAQHFQVDIDRQLRGDLEGA